MNVDTKRELVVCLEEGPKNQGKNHRTFVPDGKRREWKNKILTPQAIMGGVRGLDLPCVLYKAPVKRVNKYSKEIYALELSGVNHLGEYYLSKHLFNISFLRDPYLKTLPSRVASRSTIEVVYQLGNYHRLQDGIDHSGLFLHCMLVTCDRGTQEFHGWNHLQTVIEPLVADVEISLPDVDYEEAKKGYFYPLLPPAGQRKPYADAKFVDSIYYQLESSGFLEKKQEDDGGHKYRVSAGGPPVEKTPEFTDDWLFEYGRNVRTSQHREEDLIFIDCIKRDIVLHKNSDFYFGPLEMYCYGCGQLKQLSSHFHDPESGTEMEWYDLTLDDPRSEKMEAVDPFFCVNCEAELLEGE